MYSQKSYCCQVTIIIKYAQGRGSWVGCCVTYGFHWTSCFAQPPSWVCVLSALTATWLWHNLSTTHAKGVRRDLLSLWYSWYGLQPSLSPVLLYLAGKCFLSLWPRLFCRYSIIVYISVIVNTIFNYGYMKL